MTATQDIPARWTAAGALRLGMCGLAVAVGVGGHPHLALGVAVAVVVSLIMREFATPGVDLAAAFVLAGHAAGSAADLPARIAMWDVTFHVLMAALITIALGAALPPLHLAGMVLLCCLGMAVALEWEALEYLVDLVSGTRPAHPLTDAGTDLAGDALGILVGLGFLRAVQRAGHRMPQPRFLEDGS